jgi:phosphatidylserine synthase
MRKTQIDLFGQFTFDASVYSVMLMMLTAILALLMISTIRYSNFKNTSDKPGMSRNQMVLLAAIIIIAIYQWSQIVLLIMATCYASLGPVAKIFSLLRSRHSTEEPSGTVSSDVGLNQQS